jgi:glycosyltransferase involved in cell wall biosynthesis
MTCRVSILMTVYNGMPYLPQTIQSIHGQTEQDWRFVIVNDGSTDGTREFLESLSDERLVILHQPNAGTAAAANRGLQECNTRYVARMDADDVSLPTRLAEQAAYLDGHPEIGLVGAQMIPFGKAGFGASLQLPTKHNQIMSALMEGRHGMAHSCIMLRTELLKQIDGYWALPLVDDWDMMLRIGEISELANIDRVLHHYRVHERSLTGSRMRAMRFSIAYACELARRRQAELPPISVNDFQHKRGVRPVWQRAAEAVDLHARGQYRVALAELYGGHRLRGSARMGWAALCSPQLTIERLARVFKPRRTPVKSAAVRNGRNPAQQPVFQRGFSND